VHNSLENDFYTNLPENRQNFRTGNNNVKVKTERTPIKAIVIVKKIQYGWINVCW